MDNIFVEFLPPWVETGLQPAFYDKESGTVLQQTARMYARVNMLIRLFNKLAKQTKSEIERFEEVVDTRVTDFENSVNETVANYIELFNQLHDYVQDYFANLDVQEEINNKLDQMAEDGILDEIITQYIQANVAWCFDTVAEMKVATNFVSGSYARTLGFHSINDGGGGLYKIVENETPNEMDIISVGELQAKLIYDNQINIKQLGAYGDDSNDDSDYIIRALQLNRPVYIPAGTFKLTKNINTGSINIRGAGQFKTFIKAYDDIEGDVITINSDHVKLEDFTLSSPNYDYNVIGTTDTKTGIKINDKHHITLKNVRVVGFNNGIYANYGWCLSLYDVIILCCNNGFYSINEFNNCVFVRCIMNYCEVGFGFNGGNGSTFNTCDFENNTNAIFSNNRGDLLFTGCYFENNRESVFKVRWGIRPLDALTVEGSTFYCGNQSQCVFSYHAKPDTPIVARDCTFRNNENLPANTTPIFVPFDNTQCVPHLIGGVVGASYSVANNIWHDNLKSNHLEVEDWITLNENISIQDFNLYENNKHIFGTLTVQFENGVPNASTTIGILTNKYKPIVNMNGYGVITNERWQQTGNNLAYFYISGTNISVRNGDGTSKFLKVYVDYIRN